MITRYASRKKYWLRVDDLLTKQYKCFVRLFPYLLHYHFFSDAETVKFCCNATNEKKEALAILFKFLFFSFSLLNNINQGTKLCNSYVSTSVSTIRYTV